MLTSSKFHYYCNYNDYNDNNNNYYYVCAYYRLTAHGVNRLVGLVQHCYYPGNQQQHNIHEPNGSALSLTEITLAAEKHIFTSGNIRTVSSVSRDFIYTY